ncbi:MAG: desulfoferrodoxin [Kiritimatiellia bacterium]
MAKRMDVYKCEICGQIIEVLHEGVGTLVCCNQPMKLMVENTVDASKEKHVPVVEKTHKGFRVRVGSVPHPMEAKHYIEWIQALADGVSYRKFLKPGDEPQAEFEVNADKIVPREYCNLHGLWKD